MTDGSGQDRGQDRASGAAGRGRCLARDYPYEIPDGCFVYLDGVGLPLGAGGAAWDCDAPVKTGAGERPLGAVVGRARRIPVIAYGSNQSPAQLHRKFADIPGASGAIPVRRAVLHDHDSVYSAHFARYGALPATLYPSRGTAVAVAITWLTRDQLAIMHRSEARGRNYDFARVDGIRMEQADGHVLERAWVYVSRAGALGEKGSPVALAAIAAHRRRFAAQPMERMLNWVRHRHGHRGDIDGFIAMLRDDEGRRASWTARLKTAALRGAFPGLSPIAAESDGFDGA